MELLCLCSVMLNQFFLNSKLKLGIRQNDVSDVQNKGRHDALLKFSMVVGNADPFLPTETLLIASVSLTRFLDVGIGKDIKVEQTLQKPHCDRLGVCGSSYSCSDSHISEKPLQVFQYAGKVSFCIQHELLPEDSSVTTAESLKSFWQLLFYLLKI